MRPGVRFGIGLIAAAITFTALTLFAKPYYEYGSKNSHCWYGERNEQRQNDSTKTDY